MIAPLSAAGAELPPGTGGHRAAEAGNPLGAWVLFGALTSLTIGSVVLVGGWVCGIDVLKNLIPGTVSMKASTAFGLIGGSVALLLLADPSASSARRRTGQGFALVVTVVGLLFMAEYIFGVSLGIDEFPFRDAAGRAAGIADPGRLAPTTAASLILVGAALLTLDLRPGSPWRVAELLILPVAAIAAITMTGYLYSIPTFYGPDSAAKMALLTATGFLVLALSIGAARPHGRFLSLATTRAPGGVLARRLMPAVFLLPLALGWVRLRGTETGLFSDSVGTWWLTAATIVVFAVLLWRVAARLNTVDGIRGELEQELYTYANHDELTGLFNRRRFREELSEHAKRTTRTHGSTALIGIDLDGLKIVNDTLGHVAGDALIARAGQAIKDRVRMTDVPARLGGDEFAVLLVDSTLEGTMRVAELLREDIAAIVVAAGTGSIHASASIGVAHSPHPIADDGWYLLALADEAMYTAKRAGGGRVVLGETGGVVAGT